jgi:general secretion pathway protein G
VRPLLARRPPAENASETGFTLIELLVVFSILALLLTLATPRYFKAVDGGKEKVQAQNLATLRDAIDKFRADQGQYPKRLQEVVDKRYLREIPLDPVSGSRAWATEPYPNNMEPGIYDVRPPNVPVLLQPQGSTP